MAMIPLALAGVPALLGSIGAIMDIVKKAKGGAAKSRAMGAALSVISKYPLLERRSRYRKGGTLRPPKKRGKGPIADILSSIPLLGMIAGPIARSFGAGGRYATRPAPRRGMGGVYVAPHISHTKYGVPVHVKGYHRAPTHRGLGGTYVRPHVSHTKYGVPVHVKGYHRPSRGGLLYPAGAPRGRGLLSPAGGFLPYTTI